MSKPSDSIVKIITLSEAASNAVESALSEGSGCQDSGSKDFTAMTGLPTPDGVSIDVTEAQAESAANVASFKRQAQACKDAQRDPAASEEEKLGAACLEAVLNKKVAHHEGKLEQSISITGSAERLKSEVMERLQGQRSGAGVQHLLATEEWSGQLSRAGARFHELSAKQQADFKDEFGPEVTEEIRDANGRGFFGTVGDYISDAWDWCVERQWYLAAGVALLLGGVTIFALYKAGAIAAALGGGAALAAIPVATEVVAILPAVASAPALAESVAIALL